MSRLAEIQEEIRAGRAVVANIKDKESVQWAKSQGVFVYIGRRKKGKSLWGNPFILEDSRNDAERNRVCDCHQLWLKSQTKLLEKIPDLRGKVLFCFCYPLRCHGDELVRRANESLSASERIEHIIRILKEEAPG